MLHWILPLSCDYWKRNTNAIHLCHPDTQHTWTWALHHPPKWFRGGQFWRNLVFMRFSVGANLVFAPPQTLFLLQDGANTRFAPTNLSAPEPQMVNFSLDSFFEFRPEKSFSSALRPTCPFGDPEDSDTIILQRWFNSSLSRGQEWTKRKSTLCGFPFSRE